IRYANSCGPSLVSVSTDCADMATSCVYSMGDSCSTDAGVLEVVAGTTYFITLDSIYESDGSGTYDIDIQENVCGDGILSAAEQCDDGGTATGDGCNGLCQVELYSRCNGSSCWPINILLAPAEADVLASRDAIAAMTGGRVDYLAARTS